MVEALIEQAAWLTPTSLFLLLNVVIATILVSSAFHKKPLHGSGGGEDLSSSSPPSFNPPQPLARAPSLFSRVASFNFSNYDSDQQQLHHHQHHHSSPSFFSRVTSFNFSGRADEPGSDHENVTREINQDPVPKQEVTTTDVSRQSHVTSKTEGRTLVRAASLLSRVASFTTGARAPAVEVDGVGNGKNSESSENGKKLGSQQEQAGRVKVVKKSVKKKKAVGNNNGTTSFSRAEEEVDTKADDFINRFKQQLKLQRLDSLLRCRST